MKFSGLTIGVPKEIMEGEHRVSASPETVEQMVKEGAKVIVQSNAGLGSYFHDEEYVAAGATIEKDVQKLFNQADLILKVKEPLFNNELGKHEVELMRKGQYLITFLHPASPVNHEMIKNLAQQGVISLTLDGIPRITKAQAMDALTSMSTVAGYQGFMRAANRLPKFVPLIGTAVGMIKPANVLVIGAGVAGLQSIATAKRLGAQVQAADIRPDAAEQAQSLGAKAIDLGVPAEIAIGEGGYARALPEEWLKKEREILKDAIIDADIIILTALVPGRVAPIIVTEEMVKQMRPGSVIVDISIDQGGNCEITEPGKVVEKHGVTIKGTKNIPGMLPTSATWMFAKNVLNLISYLVEDKKIDITKDDEIISSILVTDGEKIVHAGTLEAMGK